MFVIGVSAFGIIQAILIVAACVMLLAVITWVYMDFQDYREKQIARREQRAAERLENLRRVYERFIK